MDTMKVIVCLVVFLSTFSSFGQPARGGGINFPAGNIDVTNVVDGILSGSNHFTGSFSGDVFDETSLRHSLTNMVHFINVMDYIPDGAVFSTAYIQKAIDQTTNSFQMNATVAFFSNSLSVVYFPNGTYYINGPLFVRVNGTIFLGQGGWNRTRIEQTANTNVFRALPWVGWNEGGANTMYNTTFRNISFAMQSSFGTANRAIALSLESPTPANFMWRRVQVDNCLFNNFYIAIRASHGVGLDVRNSEIRLNCHGAWLTKFDRANFYNCTIGEGQDGSTWGTNDSTCWRIESGLSGSFSTTIIGCESAGSRKIVHATGGDISIIGHNTELDNGYVLSESYGPAFHFESGVQSVALQGLRVGSVNDYGHGTNPIIAFDGGSGRKAEIRGTDIGSANVYPQVRLNTAGDFVNVVGNGALRVTNTAEVVGYLAPRLNAGQPSIIALTTNNGVALTNLNLVYATNTYYISPESASFSGGARLNPGSAGAAPGNFIEGFNAGSGTCLYSFSIPWQTTNVSLTIPFSCAVQSFWTNQFQSVYYSPQGRVLGTLTTAGTIDCNNTVSNFTYNMPFPVTNAPKHAYFFVLASTNATARYLGPSWKVEVMTSDQKQ